MCKRLLFFISIFCVTNAVIAQPFFQSPPSGPTSTGGSLPKVSTTPISPSNFNNQTSQINSQNQANFKQQLNQKLNAIKTPPLSSFQSPTPSVPTDAASGLKNMNPSTPTTNSTSSPSTVPAEDTPLPSTSSAPSSTLPAASAPPPATKPQVYTGFQGSDNTDNKNNPPPANSSGGWNIKY
jgi:hypothetical protein